MPTRALIGACWVLFLVFWVRWIIAGFGNRDSGALVLGGLLLFGNLVCWSVWRPRVELRGDELHVVRPFSRVRLHRSEILSVGVGVGGLGQEILMLTTVGGVVLVPAFEAWSSGRDSATRRALSKAGLRIEEWLGAGGVATVHSAWSTPREEDWVSVGDTLMFPKRRRVTFGVLLAELTFGVIGLIAFAMLDARWTVRWVLGAMAFVYLARVAWRRIGDLIAGGAALTVGGAGICSNVDWTWLSTTPRFVAWSQVSSCETRPWRWPTRFDVLVVGVRGQRDLHIPEFWFVGSDWGIATREIRVRLDALGRGGRR